MLRDYEAISFPLSQWKFTMKASRLLSRCTKHPRLFLLVGICIYCLLHYRMIGILDSQKKVETMSVDQIRVARQQAIRVKRASSVDYFACCGAGHRLNRLSDAYYLGKELDFTVRVFFGFCGLQEVFSFLFGPQPLNEAQVLDNIGADVIAGRYMSTTPDRYIKVSNEVPGYRKLERIGHNNTTTCPCIGAAGQRFNSDIELFSDLRDNRFRGRDKIDAFRQKHFAGHTVIGLHVRAGNGEKGNFEMRNRAIEDIDQWCLSMSSSLISLSQDFKDQDPPLLFIATDTTAIISKLRTALKGKMEVVEYEQERVNHGEGVLFGETGDVNSDGDRCKNGWLDSFSDMMLLSHADVLVAGRPSSFTQSLPMTLVLATAKSRRKVRKSFCEVDPSATALMCFEDLQDWCCNGNTSFSLHTIQKNDYRRIPQGQGLDLEEYKKQIVFRPRVRDACVPTPALYTDCLPYEMPDENSLARTRRPKVEGRTKKRSAEV